MNDGWKHWTKEMFKIGTPECAVFMGVMALVLAVLILTIGFWSTVLVIFLVALGVFIGGVKDKKAFIQGIANRLFPSKDNTHYHDEE